MPYRNENCSKETFSDCVRLCSGKHSDFSFPLVRSCQSHLGKLHNCYSQQPKNSSKAVEAVPTGRDLPPFLPKIFLGETEGFMFWF